MTFMSVFVLGGAFARRGEDDTAFGGSRDTRYVFNIAAIALTRLLDTDGAWARAFWADLVPHGEGVCVNSCPSTNRIESSPAVGGRAIWTSRVDARCSSFGSGL